MDNINFGDKVLIFDFPHIVRGTAEETIPEASHIAQLFFVAIGTGRKVIRKDCIFPGNKKGLSMAIDAMSDYIDIMHEDAEKLIEELSE
jgi:hypothetical protein